MVGAPPGVSVFSVTPLQVLPDIAPTLRRYEALGFQRIETGDAGRVGLRAGETALILASVRFLSGDYDAVIADRLTGRTIPYIHVESIARASARLRPHATIVQDVWTRCGTRELLIEDGGDLFILAEQVA